MWLSDELTALHSSASLRNTIHGSPFSDGDQLIKTQLWQTSPSDHFHVRAEMIHFSNINWRYFRVWGHYQRCTPAFSRLGRQETKAASGSAREPSSQPTALLALTSERILTNVSTYPATPELLLLVAVLSAGCKVIPPWIHFSSFASNNDLALRPPLLDGGNYSVKMF